MTLLITFIVGAGLLAAGTALEWLRLSKLLDTTPERLASLGVIILGALLFFIAYVVQLYLFMHHDIALFHIGKKSEAIVFE